VEGGPDRAREVRLPGLRDDHPAAGPLPRGSKGLGRPQPAGEFGLALGPMAGEPSTCSRSSASISRSIARPSATRARACRSASPPWPTTWGPAPVR
jgi:hypothetical protein